MARCSAEFVVSTRVLVGPRQRVEIERRQRLWAHADFGARLVHALQSPARRLRRAPAPLRKSRRGGAGHGERRAPTPSSRRATPSAFEQLVEQRQHADEKERPARARNRLTPRRGARTCGRGRARASSTRRERHFSRRRSPAATRASAPPDRGREDAARGRSTRCRGRRRPPSSPCAGACTTARRPDASSSSISASVRVRIAHELEQTERDDVGDRQVASRQRLRRAEPIALEQARSRASSRCRARRGVERASRAGGRDSPQPRGEIRRAFRCRSSRRRPSRSPRGEAAHREDSAGFWLADGKAISAPDELVCRPRGARGRSVSAPSS